MKKVKGDLIEMALKGEFSVIVHGANCFNTMGSGIAVDIKRVFPEAYEADQKTVRGDKAKLGNYSFAQSKGVIVVNAYTQYKFWGPGVKADYKAILDVFEKIGKDFKGHKIGYPMLGAGLAGGDWNVIEPLIDKGLAGEDHTLVIFEK